MSKSFKPFVANENTLTPIRCVTGSGTGVTILGGDRRVLWGITLQILVLECDNYMSRLGEGFAGCGVVVHSALPVNH
jgi:hypothetical protein